MTAIQAPPQVTAPAARDSFAGTLRAEWTKFRTVRGWVIGMIVAVLVTVLVGLLSAAGSMTSCNGKPCHFLHPAGPGGEAVTDTFYLVHRSLASHGSITARVTSLTGLLPTATSGRVRAGQRPGSGTRSPGTSRPTGRTGRRSAPPPCPACQPPCRPACSPPPRPSP